MPVGCVRLALIELGEQRRLFGGIATAAQFEFTHARHETGRGGLLGLDDDVPEHILHSSRRVSHLCLDGEVWGWVGSDSGCH